MYANVVLSDQSPYFFIKTYFNFGKRVLSTISLPLSKIILPNSCTRLIRNLTLVSFTHPRTYKNFSFIVHFCIRDRFVFEHSIHCFQSFIRFPFPLSVVSSAKPDTPISTPFTCISRLDSSRVIRTASLMFELNALRHKYHENVKLEIPKKRVYI